MVVSHSVFSITTRQTCGVVSLTIATINVCYSSIVETPPSMYNCHPLGRYIRDSTNGQRKEATQATDQTEVISSSLQSLLSCCEHNQYNNTGLELLFSQKKARICLNPSVLLLYSLDQGAPLSIHFISSILKHQQLVLSVRNFSLFFWQFFFAPTLMLPW